VKRAPLVLTGTVLGLAGVLTFRSTPATLALGGLSGATGTTTTVAGASPPTTSTTTASSQPTTTVAGATTTIASSAARSATGPVVNYYYGTVSITVSATGTKITSVKIATLNDGGNPRSQYIDQQSLPMLVQQVLAAQGSQIQGVSGATYTSEGFYNSLLVALKSLGLK